MSGRKYDPVVRITQSQWDAMNSQCRQAQDTAANERRERERQVAQAQRDAQQRMAALQNQFTSQIRGLSNEMREIERKQNEAFTNALQRQGAELRREIQQQRTELTNMINSVQQRIEAKEQNHRQIAEFWATQADAYIKEIDNYRHDLFTPGKLESLRRTLQQMQGDIKAEAYQSAISAARAAFNDAVTLRAEVIAAEIEWENALRRLTERAAYINSCINDAKLSEVTMCEERVQARVDFWTNGALTALENQFKPIQQIIKNPVNVTTDELVSACTALDDMRDRSFPNPDSQGNVTGGIINEARERLLLSAYRADMVNEIATVMHNEGWHVENSGYRGDDQRDELHAKIVDNNGNEMIVIVSPSAKNGALENSLRFDFFNDTEINMDTTEQVRRQITQRLNSSGIQTNLQCVPGYENRLSDNQEIRNIEQTIAGKA